MSAPETSLVSVICATPPFPRSLCRSFKRTLPVSCFQSKAVLSGLGSQPALTAQQKLRRGLGHFCVSPIFFPGLAPEAGRRQDSLREQGSGVGRR